MALSSSNQQWSTPARFVVGSKSNASDDVFEWAARHPDRVSFMRKRDGVWQPVTARQFAQQVVDVAAGLMQAGIGPGDRVGLIAQTSYEWAVCDFAIWAAGAVTVPAYPTAAAAQIAWILADSGASAALVGDDQMRSSVLDARPSLKERVWTMDDESLTALASTGGSISADAVERRRLGASADSIATIVYTSGTTGQPKGCVLTHRNLVAEVRSLMEAEDVARLVLVDGNFMLIFLPLAHILAHVAMLASIRAGMRVGFTADLDALPQEMAAFRPHLILVVPRLLEKVYNRAARRAQATGRERLFRAAADTAVAYSRALTDGAPGLGLRMRHWVFDRLVYGKLRAVFGGRLCFGACGGAPLDARLGHFMRGVGVNILDGYGLTETAAAFTLNPPTAQRFGTVGIPLPGNAVKLNPDGEVLLKGPCVFQRYWNNEQATDEVLDAAGWFRSGDLGELHDGYLTINGRKKDLIVTAAGKNVAPAFLEDRLAEHWLIDQCVVVGDKRPYITALIALDAEAFEEWKREHGRRREAGVAELSGDAQLRETVQAAIDEVNQEVSRPERIKRFRIVSTFFTVGDQLTPTQKTRRQRVLAQFADDVETLYAEPV